MRCKSIIAGIGVSFLVGTASQAAETRGLTLKLRASEAPDAQIVEEVALYSKSFALVIGNDRYANGWPRLSNGVKDAEKIAAALTAKGFQVTLKRNLNARDMRVAFENFFIDKGGDPDARLFVWYAGHGHTDDTGEGYLIPTDGVLERERRKFLRTALSLRRFGEFVRLADSKHVFTVFDSCFAGTIFDVARAAPPPQVTRVTTQPVRQFLTAGDAGQTVSDDGTFARLFVEAIEGKRRADGNRDGYLTASELGSFLDARMSNYSNNKQTPRYGKLNHPDWDQGDFVFQLASMAPSRKVSSSGGGQTPEMLFWQSITDSENPADYEDYLAQFPTGTFSRLAKRRIKALTGTKTASLSPPSFVVEGLDETLMALRTANVRELPTASSSKVMTLKVGSAVEVTGRTRFEGKDWYRVAVSGRTAYVFGTLLGKKATPVVSRPPKVETRPRVTPAVGVYRGNVERGGILNFVVGSKIPTFDGHKESTFGMIHPIRPFYSLLIRVNPDNPGDPADFRCDLCAGNVPRASHDGRRYTFKIQRSITFHDGTPLTAHDIVATYRRIIFPERGVASVRRGFFGMVERVYAADDYSVVFDLKYAAPGFIPALATPFNFVYAKRDLERYGHNWHQRNINGTGAFTFAQHQPGAFVEGRRYERYHHRGADGRPLPYLDGYKAISAPKMAVRVKAIRNNHAAIEFRGFPPKTRDDLVNALGDKITVQEGDWNCVMGASYNQLRSTVGRKFADVRVRKALSLAMDRWGGSRYLSKIALVRTVGGVAYPGHPLAASKDELMAMPPYNPDNNFRRNMARKLLAEAGRSNISFKLHNRAVDQPYKVVGTWMVHQWKTIGLDIEQQVLPTGPWYDGLRRKKTYEVGIDFNCQSIVNPLVDAAKWISSDNTGNNYASYIDRQLDAWYSEMNRSTDPTEQAAILRRFEKRVLWDESHFQVNFWWFKINPHRSYVKGWKQAPSHYLNQHLDRVWLQRSR